AVQGLGFEGVHRFLGLFGNQPGPQLTVLVGHAPLHPEGVVKLADLRRGHAGSSSRLGSGVGSCTGASAGAGMGCTSIRRIGRPISAMTMCLLSLLRRFAVRRLLDVVRRWEIFDQLVERR